MAKEQTIQLKIDRALVLKREIAERDEELKEIKKFLIAEAESREDELVGTEGGGSSWTAFGTDRSLARVTFPARALKDFIDPATEGFIKIRELAGKFFADLFEPASGYKPREKFRDLAAKVLGVDARRFIKLCETASRPTVNFEAAETAGAK